MHPQNTPSAGRTATQLVVRAEIAPAVLRMLSNHDGVMAPPLTETIKVGKPIDLAARLVPDPVADTWTGAAAKWYGSVGVTLLDVIRGYRVDSGPDQRDVYEFGSDIEAVMLAAT